MKKTILLLNLFIAGISLAADVEVPGYFGATPLKAGVSEEGVAHIREYPEEWPTKLEVLQFSPASLYQNIDDKTCRDIHTQTKQYALLPPLARERMREMVRKSNPVLVRMDVAERFQPHRLIPALRAALKEAGHDPLTIVIKNRIAVQDVKFRITYEPTAIVRNIGEVHSLEMALTDQFRDGIVRLGVMPGDIAAVDLLCDLKAGKAQIEAEVTAAQSDVTEAKPIVALEKAKALLGIFNENRPRFSQGSLRSDLGKNRVIATSLAIEDWAGRRDFDLALVIERLTDPRTGYPLQLSDEALAEATNIIVTGSAPFKASAVLTLKEAE